MIEFIDKTVADFTEEDEEYGVKTGEINLTDKLADGVEQFMAMMLGASEAAMTMGPLAKLNATEQVMVFLHSVARAYRQGLAAAIEGGLLLSATDKGFAVPSDNKDIFPDDE